MSRAPQELMSTKRVEKLRAKNKELKQQVRELERGSDDPKQATNRGQNDNQEVVQQQQPSINSTEQTVPSEPQGVPVQESISTGPSAQSPPIIGLDPETGEQDSSSTESDTSTPSSFTFSGEMAFSPLKQDDSNNSNQFSAGGIAGPIGSNAEELRYKTLVYISFPIFGIAILAMAGILIIKRKQLFQNSPKVKPVAKNRKNWCQDREVTPLNTIRDLELGNANFFEQHCGPVSSTDLKESLKS